MTERADPDRFVFDTSAIFCLLNNEAGSDRVETMLDAARSEPPTAAIVVPFISLMEIHYQLLRGHAPQVVREILNGIQLWPVEVVESDPVWRVRAAEIKTRGGLSVADAWMAALAQLRGAALVHKDPEFDALTDVRAVRLP